MVVFEQQHLKSAFRYWKIDQIEPTKPLNGNNLQCAVISYVPAVWRYFIKIVRFRAAAVVG